MWRKETEREKEIEYTTLALLCVWWSEWEIDQNECMWGKGRERERERERKRERERDSQNTLSSVRYFMTNQIPAGKMQTSMCRSKKNEVQVVGWCSDTLAMMGMWILAYLGVCGGWGGGGGGGGSRWGSSHFLTTDRYRYGIASSQHQFH